MIHAMSTSPIRGDWTGQTVDGRFPLLEWLGGTVSTSVFLTELQERQSQKGVLKLISATVGQAKAQIDCWAFTKTLSHPHLMPLLHTGRCRIDNASMLYAVTDYADEVLSDILVERPLTPAETGEMLTPVLDALAYLHKNGLVHGRLKPANIMAVDDQLKISSDRLHVAGEFGNPFPGPSAFDAPELESGTIAPAADLWSLGITLIQSLTQLPPLWDRTKPTDPIVPASIPQPFADIARGCLRSDPARRYTLGEVKARLQGAWTRPGPVAKPNRTPHAKLGVAALVVGLLAVAGVIAALQFRSGPTQPTPAEVQTDAEQPTPSEAAPPAKAAAKPSAAQRMSPESAPLPPSVPEARTLKAAAGNGAIATRVLPDVLPAAMESIKGKVDVSVRVTVDPGGDVTDASLNSPGSSRYFAGVTLEAAKKWKFKPAQADGQPVPSVWILKFEFTQTGIEVTPFQASP
jgi:TonB family protein